MALERGQKLPFTVTCIIKDTVIRECRAGYRVGAHMIRKDLAQRLGMKVYKSKIAYASSINNKVTETSNEFVLADVEIYDIKFEGLKLMVFEQLDVFDMVLDAYILGPERAVVNQQSTANHRGPTLYTFSNEEGTETCTIYKRMDPNEEYKGPSSFDIKAERVET